MLKAWLLLRQENCDPDNIRIMREAILLIGRKEEILQDTLDSAQDIYRNRIGVSSPFSDLQPSDFISDEAKQFLVILMAFVENLESPNDSKARSMSNELSKVKNEIAAHIDRINQIQTFDWND